MAEADKNALEPLFVTYGVSENIRVTVDYTAKLIRIWKDDGSEAYNFASPVAFVEVADLIYTLCEIFKGFKPEVL